MVAQAALNLDYARQAGKQVDRLQNSTQFTWALFERKFVQLWSLVHFVATQHSRETNQGVGDQKVQTRVPRLTAAQQKQWCKFFIFLPKQTHTHTNCCLESTAISVVGKKMGEKPKSKWGKMRPQPERASSNISGYTRTILTHSAAPSFLFPLWWRTHTIDLAVLFSPFFWCALCGLFSLTRTSLPPPSPSPPQPQLCET